MSEIQFVKPSVTRRKAIVTDIAGTTRDVIEEYVNVRGVPLN